jgi:hypothetical protein
MRRDVARERRTIGESDAELDPYQPLLSRRYSPNAELKSRTRTASEN